MLHGTFHDCGFRSLLKLNIFHGDFFFPMGKTFVYFIASKLKWILPCGKETSMWMWVNGLKSRSPGLVLHFLIWSINLPPHAPRFIPQGGCSKTQISSRPCTASVPALAVAAFQVESKPHCSWSFITLSNLRPCILTLSLHLWYSLLALNYLQFWIICTCYFYHPHLFIKPDWVLPLPAQTQAEQFLSLMVLYPAHHSSDHTCSYLPPSSKVKELLNSRDCAFVYILSISPGLST